MGKTIQDIRRKDAAKMARAAGPVIKVGPQQKKRVRKTSKPSNRGVNAHVGWRVITTLPVDMRPKRKKSADSTAETVTLTPPAAAQDSTQ